MIQEIQKTIGLEGGYVDDPLDAGGETKYGISKRAYPHENIASLTPEAAEIIYKRDYWDRLFLDSYSFKPFRWKLFDIAVNQGVASATAYLGLLKSKKDTIDAVWELVEMQTKRYANIVYNKPAQVKYIRGWVNRAFETGRELV